MQSLKLLIVSSTLTPGTNFLACSLMVRQYTVNIPYAGSSPAVPANDYSSGSRVLDEVRRAVGCPQPQLPEEHERSTMAWEQSHWVRGSLVWTPDCRSGVGGFDPRCTRREG